MTISVVSSPVYSRNAVDAAAVAAAVGAAAAAAAVGAATVVSAFVSSTAIDAVGACRRW